MTKRKSGGGFPACALRALRDPAEVKRRREIRAVTYVHWRSISHALIEGGRYGLRNLQAKED